MNEAVVAAGLTELNSLAQAEYREPLDSVLADPDSKHAAIRIGRLVGVLLKEPFAIPHELPEPSEFTVAYRAWHLVGPDEFAAPDRAATWQRKALLQMRYELAAEDPNLATMTEYNFAQYACHEVGFFGFFARTLRRYICGDPELKKKIDAALKRAAKADQRMPELTPEMIVGAGGLTLGVVLVQNIPFLGIVGAPAVAAVVVILYSLGIDAFCEWSKSLRTDEDEKH